MINEFRYQNGYTNRYMVLRNGLKEFVEKISQPSVNLDPSFDLADYVTNFVRNEQYFPEVAKLAKEQDFSL